MGSPHILQQSGVLPGSLRALDQEEVHGASQAEYHALIHQEPVKNQNIEPRIRLSCTPSLYMSYQLLGKLGTRQHFQKVITKKQYNLH
jgi:hypothetical protein